MVSADLLAPMQKVRLFGCSGAPGRVGSAVEVMSAVRLGAERKGVWVAFWQLGKCGARGGTGGCAAHQFGRGAVSDFSGEMCDPVQNLRWR